MQTQLETSGPGDFEDATAVLPPFGSWWSVPDFLATQSYPRILK
jgi:hypothetical protein